MIPDKLFAYTIFVIIALVILGIGGKNKGEIKDLFFRIRYYMKHGKPEKKNKNEEKSNENTYNNSKESVKKSSMDELDDF